MTNCDRSYILSAKHGVLALSDIIDPYELSIKELAADEKRKWVDTVDQKIRELVTKRDTVHLVCGREYYKPIFRTLQKIGCRVRSPLSGRSLGNRISFLRQENREEALSSQITEFYKLLTDLFLGQDGGRLFSKTHGQMRWPKRGVYFILEPNERIGISKFRPLLQRVTRVGTHAVSRGSKATLWNRLSTHRGGANGAGNHRSSIFRLHIGAALIQKDPTRWHVPTWGFGQVAPRETQQNELSLEHHVSSIIGDMRVLWLDVPDDPSPHSDRAYLERNAIGLLSRHALVNRASSSGWLGNSSKNVQIALSGLWNLNHLYVLPDREFLHVLSKYISVTLGKTPAPTESIAPVAWYTKCSQGDSDQLPLFE
jgi:hypothetical protein